MIAPFIWFVLITLAVVFAVPRMLDTFLYFFDKRSKLYMDETDLITARNNALKEQIKLQQMSDQLAERRRKQV